MNILSVIYMVFLYCALAGVSTAGSLSDHGDGTVTDSGTLLMWQQGESSLMTWEAALTYCEELTLAGFNDWRLPNRKELLSLLDDTRHWPSLNTTMFPNATTYYWSSTTYVRNASLAWHMNFYTNAYEQIYPKTNTDADSARCVRGGQ